MGPTHLEGGIWRDKPKETPNQGKRYVYTLTIQYQATKSTVRCKRDLGT